MQTRPDLLVGHTLDGRYRIESRLGAGGFGEVYLGRHLMLGSQVALKVLSGERARDATAAKRFVREARSAFRVDHPHCVRVTDLGAAEGILYIVMEYLDGRTIGEELAVDGPMTSARAARIAAQVASALAHAHGLGLVHRDLKPDNVMLVSRDGDPDYVKVLDFGLARVFDEHGDLAGTAVSLSPLTQDGLVFGTPEYMSPEQASGGEVGPPSDVYSLGAVLYHMVTGAVPFSGATFTDTLARQVREVPAPPSERRPDLAIAPELERLILDCLAKPPTARPGDTRAVAERLRELGGGSQTSSGAVPSRVAATISASETMDLDASHVVSAARTQGLEPVTPAPERKRTVWWVGGIALMGAAAVIGFALKRSGDGGDSPRVAAPSPITSPSPSPITTPSAIPAPEAVPVSAPDAAPARPEKSAAQVQAEKHVRAAEAARKAGNVLRQLAEADQAHGLDPRNRRAAELMGEALVKSGDKTRGCPLLKRSRALYRQAGCAD